MSGHAALTGKTRNAYKILVGISKNKIPILIVRLILESKC